MRRQLTSLTRSALALSTIVWLCGCGTSADSRNMTIGSSNADGPFAETLRRAMCVRSVTGRDDTSTFWGSLVSNQDYSDALTGSLKAAGLDAPSGACKYPIDVHILGIIQYNHMFSIDVTAHANYEVFGADGQPILLETISASASSDASFGPIRIKRANEGAVRESIFQFLEKLRGVKLSEL